MYHFASMCLSSHLNTQVLFYDDHDSHFCYSALDILCIYIIHYFILKAGDSVHDYPNDNVPNIKLKNLYGNARMNCIRHYGTLKFTPPHMNSFLVETWEAFKLSSAEITRKGFKKTHLLLLSPPGIGTNRQAFLAGIKHSNREK